MRIRAAVALAALVLALPACGDEPAEDSGAGPASPQELAAVLVAPEDLGEGWSVVNYPDSGAELASGVVTEETSKMLPQFEFCDAASEESDAAADALQWVAFRQLDYDTGTETAPPTSRGPDDQARPEHHLVFVQEFLLSAPAADVEQTYDALAPGVEACWGETTEYPDGEVGSSTRLEVPDVGDDRIGTRELVEEPGPADRSATWDLRTVIARDGDVLLVIMVAEITTPGVQPMLDDATVDGYLTTIVDKLS